MSRPALELADVFRLHGPSYRLRHNLPASHLRVMRAIETCRTAALGGHVERCDQCAHERIAYNSCRNRHCPKCQRLEALDWLGDRQQELLPVPYFHVVFTVPAPLAELALRNPRPLYSLLLRTSAEALLTIAADPRHLGAVIGFFSILHTWGQNLLFHPHVHCVVTGGGLPPGQQRWIACRPDFFLSVRVLSRLFRRLFLEALDRAWRRGELIFPGQIAGLAARPAWTEFLDALRRQEWVVYAKPPFGGPEQVLEYLGRYTHRVALSNDRLVSCDSQTVTFRFKDYASAEPQRPRTMTLPAEEFIRRFLLHVLPAGFQRIRYYGLLANRFRAQRLGCCRALLLGARDAMLPSARQLEALQSSLGERAARCPVCRRGVMVRISIFAAASFALPTPVFDTS